MRHPSGEVTVQFSVFCESEAIGHVDLEVVHAHGFAPLQPLPAFEPLRPILDRFESAMLEGARRLAEAHKADALRKPQLPDGAMIGRGIDPDLAQRIDLDSLRAATVPARRLQFELRDSAGVRVPTRHVFVRMVPSRAGAALVTVTFDS